MDDTDSAEQNAEQRDGGVATSPDRYTLRGITRALHLLDLLAEAGATGFTVTELAQQLGASKSTTYALLRTLVAQSYAAETAPGPRYRLGRAVIRLADSLAEGIGLTDTGRPVLRRLTEATGWTSRLAVPDDGYPVFIDRVDGPGAVRFYTPLGRRELPHLSAAGKTMLSTGPDAVAARIAEETGLPRRTRNTITALADLLADLRASRDRGYAIDDEEDDEGVFCVGSAFFDRDGACAGAISITGLKRDISAWRAGELGGIVREHADLVSRGLGGPVWSEWRERAR